MSEQSRGGHLSLPVSGGYKGFASYILDYLADTTVTNRRISGLVDRAYRFGRREALFKTEGLSGRGWHLIGGLYDTTEVELQIPITWIYID